MGACLTFPLPVAVESDLGLGARGEGGKKGDWNRYVHRVTATTHTRSVAVGARGCCDGGGRATHYCVSLRHSRGRYFFGHTWAFDDYDADAGAARLTAAFIPLPAISLIFFC